jgi:hypothetical protein
MLVRLKGIVLREHPYAAVGYYIARFSNRPLYMALDPRLNLYKDLGMRTRQIRNLYRVLDRLFNFRDFGGVSSTLPLPLEMHSWNAARWSSGKTVEVKDGIDMSVGEFMEWLGVYRYSLGI